MKRIQINLGQKIVVSESDFNIVSKHRWFTWINKGRGKFSCPRARINGRYIFLSRYLLNAPDDLQVDHINRDVLDNRRENLRLCDNSLNNHNKGIFKNNKTGFKGVYFDNYHKKYRAEIRMFKKYFLGYFDSKEKAHEVCENKRKELIKSRFN